MLKPGRKSTGSFRPAGANSARGSWSAPRARPAKMWASRNTSIPVGIGIASKVGNEVVTANETATSVPPRYVAANAGM